MAKKYVCLTCAKKIKANKIPCKAVTNKLNVIDIPEELNILNKLETALIC